MPRKRAEDAPKTPFARRLIAVRELYGLQTGRPDLDKKEFAALIGKEAQTYRRYELGETEPNIATLAKIRELTGVSLNSLICGQPDVKASRASHRSMSLVSNRQEK
jgi:transcriptional regulator with XRE-family HTH domain